MLKLKIICVGQLSLYAWKLAEAEYLNRIKKQVTIEINIIKESKLNLITANIENETIKINQLLTKNDDYQWYLLDLTGILITSEQLSQTIVNNQNYQQGKIGFIIGGSNGVGQLVNNNPKITKIAFGKITLPHQLCYIVLLEQIYRALQIINNQPYHK